MTYLRFASEHVEPILEGEKTATIRYAFDRPIAEGDDVELRETGTDAPFASAEILLATTITAEHFVRLELAGHRTYDDVDELTDELAEYYDLDAGFGHRGFDGDTELYLFVFAVGERYRPPLETIRDFVLRKVEVDDVDAAADDVARAIQKHAVRRRRPDPFAELRRCISSFEPPSFTDVFASIGKGKSAEQIVDEIDAILEDPYGELGLEDERPLPLVEWKTGADRDDVDDETIESIRCGRVEDFSIGFDGDLEPRDAD